MSIWRCVTSVIIKEMQIQLRTHFAPRARARCKVWQFTVPTRTQETLRSITESPGRSFLPSSSTEPQPRAGRGRVPGAPRGIRASPALRMLSSQCRQRPGHGKRHGVWPVLPALGKWWAKSPRASWRRCRETVGATRQLQKAWPEGLGLLLLEAQAGMREKEHSPAAALRPHFARLK